MGAELRISAVFMYHFLQVFPGEMLFHGIRESVLACHVLLGTHPTKPEYASAIRLSDSFTPLLDGSIES